MANIYIDNILKNIQNSTIGVTKLLERDLEYSELLQNSTTDNEPMDETTIEPDVTTYTNGPLFINNRLNVSFEGNGEPNMFIQSSITDSETDLGFTESAVIYVTEELESVTQSIPSHHNENISSHFGLFDATSSPGLFQNGAQNKSEVASSLSSIIGTCSAVFLLIIGILFIYTQRNLIRSYVSVKRKKKNCKTPLYLTSPRSPVIFENEMYLPLPKALCKPRPAIIFNGDVANYEKHIFAYENKAFISSLSLET